MKRLLLLRHAHAEKAQPDSDDIDRPLSARGRAEALDAAECIAAAQLHCQAVLCSSAVRARQTAVIVAAQLDLAEALKIEPALYLGSQEALLGPVRRCAHELNTVLMVGHNPGLSELAQHFNHAGTRIELRTAGLCVLRFAAPTSWGDLPARPAAEITLLR